MKLRACDCAYIYRPYLILSEEMSVLCLISSWQKAIRPIKPQKMVVGTSGTRWWLSLLTRGWRLCINGSLTSPCDGARTQSWHAELPVNVLKCYVCGVTRRLLSGVWTLTPVLSASASSGNDRSVEYYNTAIDRWTALINLWISWFY